MCERNIGLLHVGRYLIQCYYVDIDTGEIDAVDVSQMFDDIDDAASIRSRRLLKLEIFF